MLSNQFKGFLPKPNVAMEIDSRTLRSALQAPHANFKNAFSDNISNNARKQPEYLEQRRQTELQTMGIPLDAPAAERPNYGYIPRNNVRHTQLSGDYGDTTLVFKKHINPRVSFTVGDSNRLNAMEEGAKTTPLIGGRRRGLAPMTTNPGGYEGQVKSKNTPYVEAQIRGGVSPRSVKKVLSGTKEGAKELKAAFAAQGIKVRAGVRKGPSDGAPSAAASAVKSFVKREVAAPAIVAKQKAVRAAQAAYAKTPAGKAKIAAAEAYREAAIKNYSAV